MEERRTKQNKYEVSGIENPAFTHETNTQEAPSTETNQKEKTRDQWSSPVEFLLSCVAMSVGLGNIWRFPFTAYENGGGAFLIPYLIVLFFIGKPLYYMELCMGQFSSYGSVKVWGMVPAFKGVGYGQAVATWCVVTYYVSLMALTIFYFFASFSSTLPWSVCPEGAKDCVDASSNVNISMLNDTVSSSEYYFEKEVIHRYPKGLDDGIFAPDWRLSLCLLGSWVILFLTLVKGVKSSGKAAYFTALFPYAVLFILLGRGVTLPGAANGILFFITPQWEKLLDPKVWFAAVGQCFFSLSVGFGSIIMFSSYNGFRHNVHRDAMIISITDTLTSLLAGFTIFSILGHLAYKMGVSDVSLVIKGGGSSLAFVSYPDVLSRFQYVPQVFAVLFFLMLFTLGVGSASALAGCIITIICDENPKFKRPIVTLIVCLLGFGLGLFYVTPQGQYILTLIDHYGASLIIYVLAFCEIIAVQWIYGFNTFARDVEFMLGKRPGRYWQFCWVFFIPFLLFVVFLYSLIQQKPLKTGSYVFGPGANAFGIFIIIISVGLLPVMFGHAVWKKKQYGYSLWKSIMYTFKADDRWFPKDPEHKKLYIEFKNKKETVPLEGIDNPASVVTNGSTYPNLNSVSTVS